MSDVIDRRVRASAERTAGFLNTDWNPRDVPAGTVSRNVVLRTQDGAAVTGSLYCAGQPDTVVCIMHPREFMACHYLIPDILGAGFAAWSQSPRSVGNDLRLEHEFALFDVAAGLTFLRQGGFKRIVLLGNSGGASLYSFYIQQAACEGVRRIERTPGGRPTNLAGLSMPQADGVVFVAPHPGQGALLLECIDPSVTDERDPLSVNPALDALDARNGFALPPDRTTYAAEFVRRYRDAQRERVEKLDSIARALIGERASARKASAGAQDERLRRRASHSEIMTVWRTDADLRCFDLSLDPSERKFGTLWGKNPLTSNYGAIGFARNCTPEAWLSTWSGLSSNAALMKTAPAIEQPAMLVEYSGDTSTFPMVIDDIYSAVGTSQKMRLRVRGDHHGRAIAEGEEPGRYVAGRAIAKWLQDNFRS